MLTDKNKTIDEIEKVTVSAFLRRRLIVMVKMLKFVETLAEAESYIQQGHVSVGKEIVKDPDYLVSRNMEDHVTWDDKSKIKRKVQQFKEEADDYDLL